jgi:hypothetical protein
MALRADVLKAVVAEHLIARKVAEKFRLYSPRYPEVKDLRLGITESALDFDDGRLVF